MPVAFARAEVCVRPCQCEVVSLLPGKLRTASLGALAGRESFIDAMISCEEPSTGDFDGETHVRGRFRRKEARRSLLHRPPIGVAGRDQRPEGDV